jgi:hypothetical protein
MLMWLSELNKLIELIETIKLICCDVVTERAMLALYIFVPDINNAS